MEFMTLSQIVSQEKVDRNVHIKNNVYVCN